MTRVEDMEEAVITAEANRHSMGGGSYDRFETGYSIVHNEQSNLG
ncbi:hypothetical protein GGD71_004899 [Variovorax guangxiensis]|uniref:Uncharacterized protein n=1 Tax=Variovorax guangxiensis TaxID=1775474 RepID=A0A840G5I7_9BURK|nr:hypothetical protein [Variovorax guangxiensis]